MIVKKPYIEAVDLRSITRHSDRCFTHVRLFPDWDPSNRVDWLVFGMASVTAKERQRTHSLEARMIAGVTDVEHDSAYALKLPLIGLQFQDLFVSYHTTHLVAWVDPNADERTFRVPTVGYDPTKHPKARLCKDKYCLPAYPNGHMIVPEGHYLPPFDKELFKLVAGKKVEITIGSVLANEDGDE